LGSGEAGGKVKRGSEVPEEEGSERRRFRGSEVQRLEEEAPLNL
jgi:hypothetical protein